MGHGLAYRGLRHGRDNQFLYRDRQPTWIFPLFRFGLCQPSLHDLKIPHRWQFSLDAVSRPFLLPVLEGTRKSSGKQQPGCEGKGLPEGVHCAEHGARSSSRSVVKEADI